jgi:hypothetical protein
LLHDFVAKFEAVFKQHMLEVENLLESYLMMVDSTLAKLAGGFWV